jgi:2-keto-4-pentenoate hydratase/2-oxohepta-3-ene-1,7-dioic acid hydratase in catechol pathway
MKLASCKERDSDRGFIAAVLDGPTFVDLDAVLVAAGRTERIPADMKQFLRDSDEMMRAAEDALDLIGSDRSAGSKEPGPHGKRLMRDRTDLELRATVPRPGKIIHTAVNFGSHLSELATWQAPEWRAHDWGKFHYEHPTGFLQAPSSVIGTDAVVRIPRFTKQLDYEIELAIVIGRTAKYVTQADAMNYVAGFCIFNDVSARDIQAREHANKVVMLGKSFDGSCPLGPWLVTADELEDPQALRMELRLNGEIRQSASTAGMKYKIRDLVSWWSNITLEPGDVITSGSPAGVIAGMKNPVWMKPGDRIDASIEGLGTLTNFVAAEE